MVKFLNLVPWGGLYFCHKPNDVIDLPEETAIARQKLGLGLVIDKSKKVPVAPPEPKVEAQKPVPPKVEAKQKTEAKPDEVAKVVETLKAAKSEPKPEAKPEPAKV